MSQIKYDDHNPTANHQGSKSPVKVLVARVVTLVSLVVSIAVLKTNKVGRDDGYDRLTYSYYRSYQYMMYVMAFGVLYSLLQIPFAVCYMKRKKFLINNNAVVLKLDFYADKVLLLLLATGAGAGLGMTMDLKRVTWKTDNDQFQTFFSINYAPAAFCLVGCLASVVSSIHSSLALSKID